MGKVVLAGLMALGLLGCASGHCRGQENLTEAAKLKWQDAEALKEQKKKRVFVYKPDGSLQCGMGQAISVKAMSEQLQGVTIFSMKKQSDGLMRIQRCGASTDKINVYEISAMDLEKATKEGFRELKN